MGAYVVANAIPPLPEGFKLESYPSAMQEQQNIPPLPEGFATEQQIKSGQVDLPEFDLPASVAFKNPWESAKTAFGLMATFDPDRQKSIWEENYPKLKFSKDDQGNYIIDGTAYGAGIGYMNKPGISTRDITQFAGQAAAFTPAAKTAQIVGRGGLGVVSDLVGSGLASRIGAAGIASAGTQAGLDVGSQAAGGTEEVSSSNIDIGDVATAGIGGAAFEGLAGPLGRLAQKFTGQFERMPRVTSGIREEFKQVAVDAGMDPDEVTDKFIRSWLKASKEATKGGKVAGTPEAIQQRGEFGIPYTRGQMTGSQKQLGLEDTLRNVRGTKASGVMEKFGEQQQAAISGATRGMQRQLGGTQDLVETPAQAAGAVKEAIQTKFGQAEEAVGQAYENVGDAFLKSEGLQNIMSNMKTLARQERFITSKELAPATKAALAKIDQAQSFFKKAGVKVKPIHLSRVDAYRKELGSLIDASKNPTDRRQVTMLKRQFDDMVDQATDKSLFTGDEAALDALKKARGLYADFRAKFSAKDQRTRFGRKVSDVAGKRMEEIASLDPNPEEVANWLFGASKLGAKNGSAELAKRMKNVLGEGSNEWNQIRQAAFLKLTEPGKNQTVTSGRQFLSRLEEATKGSGTTFMKELFTKEEIGKMRRLAKAIKRAQPDPGNPSKTSYKAAEMINQAAGQLAKILGWTSGPTGGIAAEAGVRGMGAVSGLRQAAKARAATSARPLARINLPVQAGVPATIAAEEQLVSGQ